MLIKAIMVDVDGVLVRGRPEDGRHWSTSLEVDLGLSAEDLHREFFNVHWDEIVIGRAKLEDRLPPVLQKIAPHLTADQLINYWFAQDVRLDHELLRDLAQLRRQLGRGDQLRRGRVERDGPAAFRYSKKERTTESLKATVAALFLRERSQSLQSRMSLGTTSAGCFMPANWKNSRRARP